MNTFLNLFWTGEQECDPNYKVGPWLRDKYILHYILDGQGLIEFKDHIYSIKRTNVFNLPK